MFMDLLRGKGREVTVKANLSEIESVTRVIGDLEARLGLDGDKLDALERRLLAARYGQNVLGEEKPEGLERDIKELKDRIGANNRAISEQRGYLLELELPLLESQRREALAEYEAHVADRTAVIRAEVEGLMVYQLTRGRALQWERTSRELAKAADRLSRRLGERDVTVALLPMGSRFRPESVMSGAADRPSDYQAAADRLRAVLDAGEAEIRKAQETPNNTRTVAQGDLVFLWGPGGEREQAKKAKATGSARAAERRRLGLASR